MITHSPTALTHELQWAMPWWSERAQSPDARPSSNSSMGWENGRSGHNPSCAICTTRPGCQLKLPEHELSELIWALRSPHLSKCLETLKTSASECSTWLIKISNTYRVLRLWGLYLPPSCYKTVVSNSETEVWHWRGLHGRLSGCAVLVGLVELVLGELVGWCCAPSAPCSWGETWPRSSSFLGISCGYIRSQRGPLGLN